LDIDDWLRGIGFAQYAEMFRANDINIELLGRLTNDDLKDVGVVSLGHRKKLLEAIAELGGTPVSAPTSATPPPISVPVETAGERRHLTVMFCDLVGSTSISAQLEPALQFFSALRQLIWPNLNVRGSVQRCLTHINTGQRGPRSI
jgi:hypothetical protein